jgi:hypothetical protein
MRCLKCSDECHQCALFYGIRSRENLRYTGLSNSESLGEFALRTTTHGVGELTDLTGTHGVFGSASLGGSQTDWRL